jgi:hypothetical protein
MRRKRDFIDAIEQVVQAAEMCQQRRCRFRTDAGHARNVVHRIATQREKIGDLFGTYA